MIFILAGHCEHADQLAAKKGIPRAKYRYIQRPECLLGLANVEIWVLDSWTTFRSHTEVVNITSCLREIEYRVKIKYFSGV